MSDRRLMARKPDYLMFVLVVILSLFGLVMVFSASYYNHAVKESGTGISVLTKQAGFVGGGLLLMIVAMAIPYHWYNRFRIQNVYNILHIPIKFLGDYSLIPILAVLVSVILLVIVLLLPGDLNGAKRWINIASVSVQPSEIGRFAMILFVADEFARKREDLVQRRDFLRFLKAFMPSLIVTGVICSLILLGSNLSMTAATGLTFICMCIVSGINGKFIFWMFCAAIGVGVFFGVTESYRMARLRIFWDPFVDPQGNGYQLVQSLYALGAGGLTGVGIGNSTQKYLYLTYGDSDFIFSIIAEEIGFIGVMLLLAVYCALIYRGLHSAIYAADANGLIMATGIVSTIAIQLFINIAVCCSAMPPTGLPLPFISAGGSSMLVFMVETGMLLSVSRFSRKA